MYVPIMFVDPSSLSYGFIHDAPANSLMIGGRERQPLWIVETNEQRVAIFLSGARDYQWQTMLTAENYDWQGSVLSPVRLEVDPARIVDAHDSKPGSVRCYDGKLSVKVFSPNSIRQTFWMHIGSAPGVKGEVYYPHWRLRIGDGKEAITLAQFGAGVFTFVDLEGCF
jgi:hypothetical protein